MNNATLDFSYKELMEYLEEKKQKLGYQQFGNDQQFGYDICCEVVKLFFLDKLKLKIVREV